MIKRLELTQNHEVFGNPAPLGLLGLAIASFALAPLSFGMKAGPGVLETIALYALLFGGGCQFITGIMDFANKNAFGGVVFTLFSFNWFTNAATLYLATRGVFLSPDVVFYVDITLLVVLSMLTYGFGFFSLTLFVFLLDIDLIYVLRIAKYLTHSPAFNVPLGILVVILGVISVWLALATLINPVAGRQVFVETDPVFRAPRKSTFDWTVRNSTFRILYRHWQDHAFDPLAIEDLVTALPKKAQAQNIIPDLVYLEEFGALKLDRAATDAQPILGARLTAAGIDIYEQISLKKWG